MGDLQTPVPDFSLDFDDAFATCLSTLEKSEKIIEQMTLSQELFV
jgi:hypothetical protein